MNYLSRNDLSFFTRDIELLVSRLDRDLDGRISYLEVRIFKNSFRMKYTQSPRNTSLFKNFIFNIKYLVR